ncbi:MAG: Fic family protein [Candidatus Marinimicrobia bacterium]|nr:Fic family protein [Candidatus Neomarinimicrobiota bacterium]
MSDNVSDSKILKIMTFKSGQFVFSSKFEPVIKEGLLRAKVLYCSFKDLPILPAAASRIYEDLIRRSIFGTAAIEGNPLNESRVKEIIDEPSVEKIKENAEREIVNLKNAYDVALEIAKEKDFKLTESIIKKVHYLIVKDLNDEEMLPGIYRNQVVKVGNVEHGGIYTPPKTRADIKNLMKVFIEWLASDRIKKVDPIIKAGIAHYHFCLIHPFADGNGRTARLIEAIILFNADIKYIPIMLSNYYYSNIDQYYTVFSKTIKAKNNSITYFIKFVIDGFTKSTEVVSISVKDLIRTMLLKQYYEINLRARFFTQRQFDLINYLLTHSAKITLKDLFTKTPYKFIYKDVSERTARRDLDKLTKGNFLITESGMLYKVNRQIID